SVLLLRRFWVVPAPHPRACDNQADPPGTCRRPRIFGCMLAGHTLEKVMKRHSRTRNYSWLPTGLAGAALAAAALLGTTALLVARRARRAERDNPPAGHFLDIEGVHFHYL